MESVNLIKQGRLIRKSNRVPGVIYEQAATAGEIKASVRGVSVHLFSFYPTCYLVSCLTTSKLLAIRFFDPLGAKFILLIPLVSDVNTPHN